MIFRYDFSNVLDEIPEVLRKRVEKYFSEIMKYYYEGKFEPSELNGAKFSETVYRILESIIDPNDNYTRFGLSIRDLDQKLRQFENESSFPDTIRFHIPKLISSIYKIRNRRGVGHAHGEISPNRHDAVLIVTIAKWIVAELIRYFNGIDVTAAYNMVETLAIKEYSIIWTVSDKKRVLDNNQSFKNQTMLLLYSETSNEILVEKLIEWLEPSRPQDYIRNVIKPLHKARFIEYDLVNKSANISPKGIRYVEEKLDLSY